VSNAACCTRIRNSLKYVAYTDQDEFMHDLRGVCQAPTRDAAEMALPKLSER
jgi:transposase-like protein